MSIKNFYEHTPKTGKIEQIVMLLHGVGSNGQDLISLAPLWEKFVPNALFISPDAPFVCDMVPPGYPNAYQWFSLQNRDLHILAQGLDTVFPLVERFIEEQLAVHGLGYKDLALVGFSQGTMTSLHVAPRLKQEIAGVAGYSGRLLPGGAITHRPPILLIHGEADEVVPVSAWHEAKSALTAQGFTVTGYTTPGLAHSIDMPGIEQGGAFLRGVFER